MRDTRTIKDVSDVKYRCVTYVSNEISHIHRPNTRRKRKFKRMAVEYETTPSTPGTSNAATMFPIVSNSVKKRVMKHTSQENFRANLFFCGKRKRSHRDRYDYEHYRLHSSSVPRQRDFFTPKNSYLEYKNRNRGSYAKQCERILPLNKTIISKIEKISQDSSSKGDSLLATDASRPIIGFPFDSTCLSERNDPAESSQIRIPSRVFNLRSDDLYKSSPIVSTTTTVMPNASQLKAGPSDVGGGVSCSTSQNQLKLGTKSGSFESTFSASAVLPATCSMDIVKGLPLKTVSISGKDGLRRHHIHSHHKQKQSKRLQMKMQLQFDDPNGMDFLSSSSLSSSDSEAAETNESDREGDDELTDWPGNEAMVNFASKNDFKRAKPLRSITGTIKPMLSQIKAVNDESLAQDDDTLMSADDLPISPNAASATMYTGTASVVPLSGLTSSSSTMASSSSAAQIPPGTLHLPIKFSPAMQSNAPPVQTDVLLQPTAPRILSTTTPPASMPINIGGGGVGAIVESEMSGETSNHFLSSPSNEVREIRAGCRRIRDERPGFTIFSSVNEHLSR